MRKCLNYDLFDSFDLMINQGKTKRLNHDSFDSLDYMINHGNHLITKITVQTMFSENFKGLVL